MSNTEIDKHVLKYENFNEKLKEDLKNIEERLNVVNLKISDLIQQKHTLKVVTDKKIHPNGFKSQVNLGCNFFMEASVPDTSRMLVNIGLNYYLDFSLAEANKYLDALIKAYESKATELRNTAAQTTAHMKLLLINLHTLIDENKKG